MTVVVVGMCMAVIMGMVMLVSMRMVMVVVVVRVFMRVVVIVVMVVRVFMRMVVAVIVCMIVVMMFVDVVRVVACLLPESDRPDCDQHEQRNSADQHWHEELRRQDVLKFRLSIRTVQTIHHDRHPAQRPAGGDRAELVQVVGAVVGVFVIVSHCRNLRTPAESASGRNQGWNDERLPGEV
jgi:hypothetical protein